MGKELWVGRTLFKRFFREFFLRILEDNKDTKTVLSFGKQLKEIEIYSPKIIILQGENGLGKSSLLNQCFAIAQDTSSELKRNTKFISIDLEKLFYEAGYIPSSNKEFIDTIIATINTKESGINQYFTKFSDLKDKIAKITAHVEILLREDWPLDSQNLVLEGSESASIEQQYYNWLQKKLPRPDLDLYFNQEERLCEILIRGFLDTSSDFNVVFSIDGYEYLPEPLEVWFREKFLPQLFEQKNRILSIISGAGSISRNYRNEFAEEFLYIYNLNDNSLTCGDIARIASKQHVNLTDSEVKQIESATNGIPLAVIDVINHIHNEIPAEIIIEDMQNSRWNTLDILQKVADRFITYCKDENDRLRVFTLAMLDQYSPKILSELWGVSFADVNAVLSDLESRYFFVSDKRMHPQIRSFLRKFLLNECRNQDSSLKPVFESYQSICSSIFVEQLTQLQSVVPSVEKRYSDERFTCATTNLISSYMWIAPDQAIRYLSGIYVELIQYNPNFAAQLMWRLEEYSEILNEDSRNIIRLLTDGLTFANYDLFRNRAPVGEEEISLVEYLKTCNDTMSDFQRAILLKKNGEIAFRSSQYQNAMESFTASLDLMVNHTSELVLLYEDFLLLGFALQSIGNLNGAIDSFMYAASIRPECFLPLYEAGLTHCSCENFNDAINVLVKAVKINPDHQDAWFNLGLSYSTVKDHESAVQSFVKAIEKGPDNEVIWFEMEKSLYYSGQFEEALKAFDKLMYNNPEHVEGWLIAGQSFSAINKSEDAITALRKTIELEPETLTALIALASELDKTKSYADAIPVYEQALSLDSKNYALWLNFSKTAYNGQEFQKSVDAAKRAAELSGNELEPWLVLGDSHSALGNYSNAIDAFTKASEIDAANPLIWIHIGSSYYTQQQYTEAITAFSKAISLQPAIEGAWYNIGLCWIAQQDYNQAQDAFVKGVEIEPSNFDCWFNLGTTRFALENYQTAINDFSESLQLNPDSYDSWYQKGRAQLKIHDYNEAIIALVKAAELYNGDPEIWYDMGTAYFLSGHSQEAVQAYHQAININPDRHDYWFDSGVAKQDLGLFDEAIYSFQKSLGLLPDQASAYSRIGICNYYLQRYDQAVQYLHKALVLEPGNIEIIHFLALSCHAYGDLKSAIEYYRQKADRKPDSIETWFNMALALHAKGEYDNAIQVYKNRVLTKWNDNGEVWYNLGSAFSAKRDYMEAVRAFRQACKLLPTRQDIWYSLGITFHGMEMYGEAIQAFRKVVQLASDNAEAWFNLGLSYYIWNQYEDALESYEKVIELQPEHFAALGNLAVTFYTAEKYEKAIEYGNKAVQISDEGWVRMHLLLSYVQTNNAEKATENARALILMETAEEEIMKTIGQLEKMLVKNPDMTLAQTLIKLLNEKNIVDIPAQEEVELLNIND
jgi:tetratricopeptide (TPR) repeat protein